MASVLFCIPAFWFLAKAWNAKVQSTRFANYSLFLAFIGESVGLLTHAADPSLQQRGSRALNIAATISGIVAMALAIRALMKGSQDGGGKARPLVAGGLSLVQVLLALAPLIIAFLMADDSSPWVHNLPGNPASITLPSTNWFETDTGGKYAARFFHRKSPASVRVLVSTGDEARFSELVQRFLSRPVVTGNSRDHESGSNPAGYECTVFYSKELATDKPVFAGISYTLLKQQNTIVCVIFEGPIRYSSNAARTKEFQFYKDAATSICKSVK